jgi:hypothetical protein
VTEELAMLEAALFQLKSAAASLDPMFASRMQLSLSVLSNAIEGASQSLSAASVNDIEFALNDVAAVAGELSALDAARIEPIVVMLQADAARLKDATSLGPAVLQAIRELQGKLRVRRTAIERQTFRPEGAAEEPLPHDPGALQREALPLRQQLVSAGFATPALDTLIADPSSLRFHSINEIINELDVIAG